MILKLFTIEKYPYLFFILLWKITKYLIFTRDRPQLNLQQPDEIDVFLSSQTTKPVYLTTCSNLI